MRAGASAKAAILLMMLFASAAARAEQAAIACKPPRGKMTVQFKPDATVGDLAKWITATTCRNVVMDASLGGRAVTVLAPSELTAKQAVELFVDSLEAVQLSVKVKPMTLIVTDKALPCPAATELPPTPDFDKHVKAADETRFEVERALLDQILAHPEVAGSARIVPSVKDGKPNGFKIYAIRPRSVYTSLGFQNGDTIHSVNGLELTSPEKALEVYQQVKSATRFKVAITRRGKALTLEYVIK